MVSVDKVDWKLPVVICNNAKNPSSKTVNNVQKIDFSKFFASPKNFYLAKI